MARGWDLISISHFLHVLGTRPQAGGAVGQSLLTRAVLQGHDLSCVPCPPGASLHPLATPGRRKISFAMGWAEKQM